MSSIPPKIENDTGEQPAPLISENQVMNILKATYDAVFFFDVPNDLLICQHIREPLMKEVFSGRMALKAAVGNWIDSLVDEGDKAAAEAFMAQNVFAESRFGTELSFDFCAHSENGPGKRYTSTLCALGGRTYLFCCKDITGSRMTELPPQRDDAPEALSRESETYRLAFDFMELAMVEWDFEKKSFSATPGYGKYAMSRYSPGLIRQNLAERSGVHPDDLPRFIAFCQTCESEKKAAETTVRIKTVGGEYRWTNITVILYWNESGKISRAVAILYDVNRLIQTQTALSENRERIALILNKLLEGVVIFEINGGRPRIQYVSDTALHFYGIEKERYREAIAAGKTPDELITDRLLSDAQLETLLLRGSVHFSRVLPGASSLRHFEMLCFVEKSTDSAFYYAIIHEITQVREAQEQLERQRENYRRIYQGSDAATFDYDVSADELTYSFNDPSYGYQEKTVKDFLADIEMVTLFREAQLHEFKSCIFRILRGEELEEFSLLLNLHGHGFEWYFVRLLGVRDETGRVCRIIGTTQSIQKAKDHLMKQLRSEAAIQIALSSDALFSAAFSVDTGERVGITGEVIPEQLKPMDNISRIFAYLRANAHPDDMEMLITRIFGIKSLPLEDTARKRKFEFRLHTPASAPGEYRWVQITYMCAFNDVVNGYVLYFFVMDIDEEKRQLLHMMEKADTDAATQFLNRAAFERYCESERGNAKLSRTVNALIVLEFRFADESPGYESLQRTEQTAKALADAVRVWADKEYRLARFSDTKLLICMHALESHAVLQERVGVLQKALDRFERESMGISVFMGVTNCCHDLEKGYRAAYDQAELALLRAKETGASQSVFFLDRDGRYTEIAKRRQVYIRTFGFFEVFMDQKPVFFKTAKAKELLAILVDRRGGYLSTDEAISYLWEDEPANKITRTRYRKVAMRLKETLEEYGIGDIVEVSARRRRIAVEKVQCDLFDYVSGRAGASGLFSGNYMLNYSWAEMSSAQLNKQYWTF